MRHNQASHAGLSLQHRQDLCSIRRCFSPKAIDTTFHSSPHYLPALGPDFRAPGPWKPPGVEKGRAGGRGGEGRGNNKKVEQQQEDGPAGLPAARRRGRCQPRGGPAAPSAPGPAGGAPPGAGAGGRAGGGRPRSCLPPRPRRYASEREEPGARFATESDEKKNKFKINQWLKNTSCGKKRR